MFKPLKGQGPLCTNEVGVGWGLPVAAVGHRHNRWGPGSWGGILQASQLAACTVAAFSHFLSLHRMQAKCSGISVPTNQNTAPGPCQWTPALAEQRSRRKGSTEPLIKTWSESKFNTEMFCHPPLHESSLTFPCGPVMIY